MKQFSVSKAFRLLISYTLMRLLLLLYCPSSRTVLYIINNNIQYTVVECSVHVTKEHTITTISLGMVDRTNRNTMQWTDEQR